MKQVAGKAAGVLLFHKEVTYSSLIHCFSREMSKKVKKKKSLICLFFEMGGLKVGIICHFLFTILFTYSTKC